MKVKYNDIKNSDSLYEVSVMFSEIEKCPICKYSIRPVKLYGKMFNDKNDNTKLALMYYCNHCYETFIAQYSSLINNTIENCYEFSNLNYLSPDIYEKTIFDDYINSLSPSFTKIYNQASQAEHLKMDEIAGIGYRKALEFLIKDFLIEQNPDKADTIKNTPLGNCVNNYIDNPQLKTVASRAVWLGNDQTHYTQKFEDKDINDLKRLIQLTINWITMIYLTNEAENIEKP